MLERGSLTVSEWCQEKQLSPLAPPWVPSVLPIAPHRQDHLIFTRQNGAGERGRGVSEKALLERIKLETELLRLVALATLAVGGGSIGLLLGDQTFLRLVLATGGLLVTVGLMGTLWWQRRRIITLIEKL